MAPQEQMTDEEYQRFYAIDRSQQRLKIRRRMSPDLLGRS